MELKKIEDRLLLKYKEEATAGPRDIGKISNEIELLEMEKGKILFPGFSIDDEIRFQGLKYKILSIRGGSMYARQIKMDGTFYKCRPRRLDHSDVAYIYLLEGVKN